MNRFKLTRRSLFAGTGAGLLLLPLLNARKGWAGTPTAPRRLVIFQATNGVQSSWWPSGAGASWTLSNELSPLAPHQKDAIVFSGMNYQAQLDFPNGGVGHQSLPIMLTGQMANGTNQEGPCGIGGGISVDQFVANAFQTAPSPPAIKSLELGACYQDSESNQRSLSYNGPPSGGNPDERPPELDPNNVFARLQPLAGGNAQATAALAALNARRKSVLDLVGNDIQSMSKRLGTDDQNLIAAHLSAIRQLESELQAVAPMACSFPAVDPSLPLSDPGDLANMDAIIRAHLKLVTASFACDATRVATVMMMGPHNNTICFPFLGSQFASQSGAIEGDHHGIAHGAGDNSGGSVSTQKSLIDQWYMQVVADFVTGLKNTPDVNGGTLFDNTLVVWMNCMGNGAAHNVTDVPMIVLGGSWYFKTGQYCVAPSGSNGWAHNQLLVSIANAMTGGSLTSFGDPTYGGDAGAPWTI